jgi:sugar phosphate isomerase/epimerase
MKLGIACRLPGLDEPSPAFLPGDWRRIDSEDCRRVRAAGFRGSSLFINRPLEATAGEVQRVGKAFQRGELDIAQLNGWYEALCNPDDGLRAQGVAGMQALVRIGASLRAPTVYVRPGGLNPNGHWYAHPENHAQSTFDRIVDSLRRVLSVAETEGVLVAIEGHVLSALDTPRRMRELFDAVSSPALKFNYDPVNFIGTVKDVHDTTRILNEMNTLLGPVTAVAHAKDCRLADALVVHIDEVVLGTGTMDYPRFMTQFQRLAPDGFFIIEHLPDDQVLASAEFVVPLARQLGIPLET